ncbi:hypothetical protein OG306_00635 [Streptomyces sp. NBC_01241]|uniref:hypothetical protein n=1 Tax=Streptomyces sp. NBC_01241 TaxID=2903794 RepID=UPI00352F714C|nr:hypothetical protein OG306_00635 [Streptomyces sp. NBC_01241]
MRAEMVAVLVAVVGVAGTLLAPITTAWVSARTRLQEFTLQQRAAEITRQDEERRTEIERRRTTYIAVNSSTRLWRIRLMEDLRALRAGEIAGGHAEEARIAFQNDYAQAQMLVPDPVLHACTQVRATLADARKRMLSLAAGDTEYGDTWEVLYEYVLGTWDLITEMQTAMRRDLGITAPELPDSEGRPIPPEPGDTQ